MGRKRKSSTDESTADAAQSEEWAEGLVLPELDWSKMFLAPGEPNNVNPKGAKIDLIDGVQVFFSLEAWRFLWYCVDRAGDYEVSGLGEVQVVGPGCLYVPRVFLLKQTCSETETSPDMEAISAFHMGWLEEREAADQEPAVEGRSETFLGLWWHSHGKMQPFFSGVDHSTIQRIEGEPFMLSLVVNRRREYQARVDIFKPVRAAVLAEVSPDLRLHADEQEAFTEEFDAKYRRKAGASTTSTVYSGVGVTPTQLVNSVGSPTPASHPSMLDRGWVAEETVNGWERPPKMWEVPGMVSWYTTRHHLPLGKAKRAALVRKALDSLTPTPFLTEGQLVAAINGNPPKDMSKAVRDVLDSIPEAPDTVVVSSANGAGDKGAQGVLLVAED